MNRKYLMSQLFRKSELGWLGVNSGHFGSLSLHCETIPDYSYYLLSTSGHPHFLYNKGFYHCFSLLISKIRAKNQKSKIFFLRNLMGTDAQVKRQTDRGTDRWTDIIPWAILGTAGDQWTNCTYAKSSWSS